MKSLIEYTNIVCLSVRIIHHVFSIFAINIYDRYFCIIKSIFIDFDFIFLFLGPSKICCNYHKIVNWQIMVLINNETIPIFY